jgi:hypothetical protein
VTARIAADQLDPATRTRLGLPAARARKPAPTKAGSGGFNLTCSSCGFTPAGVTAADRHTATEGHHRWQYPAEAVRR